MRNLDETFVIGSTYGGDGSWAAFEDEIYLAYTDGSGFVRLAHSRSAQVGPNADRNCYASPRAVVDRLGRYVVYTSDLGSPSHMDVMILRIPEALWPTAPDDAPPGGGGEPDAGAGPGPGASPDAGQGPGAAGLGGGCAIAPRRGAPSTPGALVLLVRTALGARAVPPRSRAGRRGGRPSRIEPPRPSPANGVRELSRPPGLLDQPLDQTIPDGPLDRRVDPGSGDEDSQRLRALVASGLEEVEPAAFAELIVGDDRDEVRREEPERLPRRRGGRDRVARLPELARDRPSHGCDVVHDEDPAHHDAPPSTLSSIRS